MQEAEFHAYLEKYEDQILAKIILAYRLATPEAIREAYQEEQQKLAAGEKCKLGQILVRKRVIQINDYTKLMAVVRQQAQILFEKTRDGSRPDGTATSDVIKTPSPGGATANMQTQRRPSQATPDAGNPPTASEKNTAATDKRAMPARETRAYQKEESPKIQEGISEGATTKQQQDAARQPQDSRIGTRFGGYEIVNEIARGGMGIVYKARQVDLNRIVALKVLLSGGAASEVEIQRFKREAEAAATLQHPNIVAVYEIGMQEGYHYFTMDFVDGDTLQSLIKKKSRRKKMVQILEKVARALDYAHERHVVHRDIKPSNILVSAEGEPKLTDFGLAKKMDATTILTESGATLGTPFYMAPEQTLGSKNVDGRADIYGLGVILYEILTGRLPFSAGTLVDLYHKIVEEDPVPPSKINQKTEKDLEIICLKAMEKDPERRYQRGKEMAEDLERFLNGEPITAQRSSLQYRFLRKAKRYKQKLAIIGGSLVLAIALVLFIVLKNTNVKSDAERKLAEAKILYGEGQTLLQGGKFQEGMNKLDQAIQIYPAFKNAYLFRGETYQKRGDTYQVQQDYWHAIAEYDRLIQMTPQEAVAYYKKGECYFSLKEWDKAIQCLTLAIQFDANYIAAYEKRGNTYKQRFQEKLDNADFKKAMADLEQAGALKKKLPK